MKILKKTGLFDINGKQICNGDILKVEDFVGRVFYNKSIASFMVRSSSGDYALVDGSKYHTQLRYVDANEVAIVRN